MIHDGLAQFACNDAAFIFAALRSDPGGPLVRLDDGQAEAQRTFTKSDLMCPYPDCETPDLTTVSRTPGGRRDGYRHMRLAKAHEPEGMAHLLAKEAVLHWAAAHPAIAEARKEVSLGPRVADVLLTGNHGHRIAVEIQYSAIRLAAFRERNESYRAQGITPVWLWGHLGTHGPSERGVAKLRDVHREILESEQPLLWINPNVERLGWAGGDDVRLPAPDSQSTRIQVCRLDHAIEVTPSGLFPPGWRDAAERTRLHNEAEALRRAEEEAKAAARDRWVKGKLDAAREKERIRHENTWAYWQERMPMREGARCDVCGYPVLPNQARSRRRHEVCDYLM